MGAFAVWGLADSGLFGAAAIYADKVGLTTAEVRLYALLFTVDRPDEAEAYDSIINQGSLETLTGCRLEPDLADADAGTPYQFERLGYFRLDPDSSPDAFVFNRTVTLRDSWRKGRGR